jgi:hypothetical protein
MVKKLSFQYDQNILLFSKSYSKLFSVFSRRIFNEYFSHVVKRTETAQYRNFFKEKERIRLTLPIT